MTKYSSVRINFSLFLTAVLETKAREKIMCTAPFTFPPFKFLAEFWENFCALLVYAICYEHILLETWKELIEVEEKLMVQYTWFSLTHNACGVYKIFVSLENNFVKLILQSNFLLKKLFSRKFSKKQLSATNWAVF